MKRILFFLLLVAVTFSIPASAQTKMQYSSDGLPGTSATNYTDDTTDNNETSYWYYKTVASSDVATVGFYPTKISGTAAGTAIIQKSLDGINYEYLSGGTTGTAADSFTVSNVSGTQLKTWDVSSTTNTRYVYYRVKYVGASTPMSVKSHCLILIRKK